MLFTSGLVVVGCFVVATLAVFRRGQLWPVRVASSFVLFFAGRRLATVGVGFASLGARCSGLFLSLTLLWCGLLTSL